MNTPIELRHRVSSHEYPLTAPYTPLFRYIRDFWNQLDSLTFVLIMGAAALRLHNCGLEAGGDDDGGDGSDGGDGTSGGSSGGGCGDHGADWQGETVDYLPRSVYAIGVLLIFLRLLQFLKYQQHVGVLLIVLSAMKSDVLYFMVIMPSTILLTTTLLTMAIIHGDHGCALMP